MSNNLVNETRLRELVAVIGRQFEKVASIDPTEVSERLLADEEFRKKVMDAIATIEFQLASNDQHGIAKGQQNNSPETWHRVSFVDGLGSIGREGLEAFIKSLVGSGGGTGGSITYQDIIRILGDIRLFGPDDLSIATNAGGHLTLQQATHQQYGVCKPRRNSPCCPQKLSWRTMDDKIVAETKNEVHMFAPFSFPKSMPKRVNLFDKCTFIPIGIEQNCKPNNSN